MNDTAPQSLPTTPMGEQAPSREAEGRPEVARMVGTVGVVVLGAGMLMWVWNQYKFFGISFMRFAPIVWWVAGFGCLFVHAARDRTLEVRRAYGLMSWFLLGLGTTWLALSVLMAWGGAALALPLLWVLLLVGFTVTPFVDEHLQEESSEPPHGFLPTLRYCARNCLAAFPRWKRAAKDSGLVRMLSGLGVLVLGVFVLLGWLLLDKYPGGVVQNVALVALALGLIFIMVFAANEREQAWRSAAGYVVGFIGTVGVLIAVAAAGTGMFGIPDIALPYGLTFGFLGVVFLWAHIWTHGADSDVGHRGAIALALLGAVLFAVALVRSLIPPIAEMFFRRFDLPSYLVPSGFVLMSLGVAFMLLGLTLTSENRILVLMRRELGAFFYSPIAWIVIGCVGLAAWVSYMLTMNTFFGDAELMQRRNFAEPIVSNFYISGIALIILILAAPAITMRLLSEEHRSGTLEVLFTAPVGDTQVVLGKFLAGWLCMLVAWLPWVFFPAAWRFLGGENFDYRPILSYYLGSAVVGASFVAVGLFWSSLTRNQIIAYLLAAVTLLVFAFGLGPLLSLMPIEDAATKQQVEGFGNFRHHFGEFGVGRVHLAHLVFHASLAVFFCFLTVKVLESRRWR